MVIADVAPFPPMSSSSSVPVASVSFVTGLSDAPSPATNAGLILIWLQRRAVSPPRFSLALAPCVAYRHRCPSPLLSSPLLSTPLLSSPQQPMPNILLSLACLLPSFFRQCHPLSISFLPCPLSHPSLSLSLSLSLPFPIFVSVPVPVPGPCPCPFPFPFPFPLAVVLVHPRTAHIRASWGGMVYHAVQPPSAVLSFVGGFPLRPAAIVHANIAGEERIVTMARSIW